MFIRLISIGLLITLVTSLPAYLLFSDPTAATGTALLGLVAAYTFVIALASAWIVTADDQYFHVAAHNPGVNDTMWLTDAQVFNPDAVNSIEVSLAFLEAGENNTGADEVTITIGPRQAALLEDKTKTKPEDHGQHGLRDAAPLENLGERCDGVHQVHSFRMK